MMLMATATDLLVIFLALEVLSLAVYVLTGIRRDSASGAEAAFKYFLLGAFSSAFFLYGIAFTYGVTGSTRLDRVGVADGGAVDARRPDACCSALGLLLVGFAFKVSAVPFHMWTPDAYEGAPPVVTGFMSTGVKAAAFAAFVARVPLGVRAAAAATGRRSSGSIAAATMIVGHGRRRGADERQAHARVFEHRARRLPARRRSSSANDVGKARDPLLPAGLRGHEPRRLRRHRAARHARPAERRAARLRRAVARRTRRWRR